MPLPQRYSNYAAFSLDEVSQLVIECIMPWNCQLIPCACSDFIRKSRALL